MSSTAAGSLSPESETPRQQTASASKPPASSVVSGSVAQVGWEPNPVFAPLREALQKIGFSVLVDERWGHDAIPGPNLDVARWAIHEARQIARTALAAAPSGPDEQAIDPTSTAGKLKAALAVLAPPHVTRDYRPEDQAADEVRKIVRELEAALREARKANEEHPYFALLQESRQRRERAESALREEAEMLAQTNATLRDLKANWREYVEEYTVDGDELMIDNILYWLIEDTSPPPSGEPPSEQEQFAASRGWPPPEPYGGWARNPDGSYVTPEQTDEGWAVQ